MKWKLKEQRINETKSWFFENVNKNGSLLAEPKEREDPN
jgi:hypothetical protein